MQLDSRIKKWLYYSLESVRYLDDLVARLARKMGTDCARISLGRSFIACAPVDLLSWAIVAT